MARWIEEEIDGGDERIAELEESLETANAAQDMVRKAYIRGTEAWWEAHPAHGKYSGWRRIWPDMAELVTWLYGEAATDAREARIAELEAANRRLYLALGLLLKDDGGMENVLEESRDVIAELEAENARLRGALETAPKWNQGTGALYGAYGDWYVSTRRMALGLDARGQKAHNG